MENFKEIKFIKEIDPYIKPNGQKERKALYRCYCGIEFESLVQYIKSGRRKSCGCKPTKAFGLYKHPLYKRWENMMSRCYDKKSINYNNYGAKNITVCTEWHTFINFYNWSIENNWKDGLSLDRKDGTLNYSSINCRWVSNTIQTINQKLSSKNTTGYKGLIWLNDIQKYRIVISVNKQQITIGYKTDIIEAIILRDKYIIDNNLIEYPLQYLKNE